MIYNELYRKEHLCPSTSNTYTAVSEKPLPSTRCKRKIQYSSDGGGGYAYICSYL